MRRRLILLHNNPLLLHRPTLNPHHPTPHKLSHPKLAKRAARQPAGPDGVSPKLASDSEGIPAQSAPHRSPLPTARAVRNQPPTPPPQTRSASKAKEGPGVPAPKAKNLETEPPQNCTLNGKTSHNPLAPAHPVGLHREYRQKGKLRVQRCSGRTKVLAGLDYALGHAALRRLPPRPRVIRLLVPDLAVDL